MTDVKYVVMRTWRTQDGEERAEYIGDVDPDAMYDRGSIDPTHPGAWGEYGTPPLDEYQGTNEWPLETETNRERELSIGCSGEALEIGLGTIAFLAASFAVAWAIARRLTR